MKALDYRRRLGVLLLSHALLLLLPLCAEAGEKELDDLMAKMEADVVALARQVELLHKDRCSGALSGCNQNNFDECLSYFPNATCDPASDLTIPACASEGCSAKYDYTNSLISLPPKEPTDAEGNPTDPQVNQSAHSSHQFIFSISPLICFIFRS